MSDLTTLLQASIDIVRRDKVIAAQKRLIEIQAHDLRVHRECVNLLEIKLRRLATIDPSLPALLRRQA